MPETIVLYIEDNPNNQRLVQIVLEARGFRVLLAEDGPTGLARARELTPALILVDMNIPGLDGYETTTRLRSMSHLHNTPLVALTADAQPGTRERTLTAGCDGYITKPIDARRLPDQLLEFIAGKRETLPQAVETPLLREYTQRLVERLEKQVRDLTEANAELQELDRHKSQFLALLSHELRTPLTSVVGYIELFERGTLGALTPMQKEAVSVLNRNTQTLVRQLNNLLYLQQMRSSQLYREPFPLTSLLERIVADQRVRATAAGIELSAALPPSAPFNGDQSALENAFRHIIENGIKFTPSGGRVTVTLADEAARVVVAVEDTGIGIAGEAQEKIFLPFYQVDSSLARSFSGVGIGLTIARHVTEAHGGHILVRSTPGGGSAFTMVLPR